MKVRLPLQAYELGPLDPRDREGAHTAQPASKPGGVRPSAEQNCRGAPGGLSRLSIRPTLDFSSGQDLKVMKSSPMSGSMLGMTPA